MSYQDDVAKMQGAGFSGQEIQSWSDNQAVQLRQAGFSQEEVDSHQGMVAPQPGTPQVYGRIPTDDDFKNAATVILKGNDHPWYDKAVDHLKNLFSDTGVEPAEAVKASQTIPTFREIMENGGEGPKGSYLSLAARSAGTAVAQQMQGLAEMANPDPNTNSFMTKPLFTLGPNAEKPEDYWLHQKGVALQKWIDGKFPEQAEFEKANPIKTGIVGGVAQIPELVATLGTGMAASGAHSAYEEARQAGAPVEKAVEFAGKSGVLWGALGVTDVGAFIKPIQQAAPGFVPWITTKAIQALRSGVTFAGTNELGDYLSSKIAQAADIPIQYKPTLQRVVVNALTGAAVGPMARSGMKRPEEISPPAEAPVESADAAKHVDLTAKENPTGLEPAYDFETDSYGLKNQKGEFTQTGFGSETEAQNAARQEVAPKDLTARIEPEELQKYKDKVSEDAEKLGFNLTPQQVDAAAQRLAEANNKVEQAKGPGALPEKEPERPVYETIPKKPLGLADFVRKAGGVNDEGGDIRSILGGAKYRPGLINGEGRSLDDMARSAHESGYFPEKGEERPSVNEFLDKLNNDLHGRSQHSEHDLEQAQAYEDALHKNSEIDRLSHETGIRTEGKTHTQFWDEVAQHLSLEEAYNKKQEYARGAKEAYEAWRTEALEPEELEATSKEELEHERTQDNIAKDKKTLPESLVPSRPTASGKGEGEESSGPGGRGTEPPRSTNETEESADAAASVRTEAGARGRNAVTGKSLEEEFLYHKGLNRGILSSKNISSPELRALSDFVEKVAPQSRFKVREGNLSEKESEFVHGHYDPMEDLITLSTMAPDKWNTTAHEALHAVSKLLTDKEYETLVREGLKRDLMEKYNIEKNYSDRPDLHQEEMIAHWFGDYISGEKTKGSKEAKGLFQKVMDILSQISSKVREIFGNASAEDIFKKIKSGEVGQREADGQNFEGKLYKKESNDKEEKPTLGDAIRGIRDTFSPTAAGEKAKQTETAIRGAYGEAKRERAIAETALNEFARQANKMTPQEHSDFYNYVEGRSSGVKLKNKQFQGMADTVRDIYNTYKGYIQSMPEKRMMNFVSDYFPHLWADGQEKKIQDFMNVWWQQGSGRNMKKRIIPTIADGLEFGLKLKEPNPVRATSAYAGTMSNYLASVKVLRSIINDLGGSYYADGKQPEGYAPLVGRNAERIENARIDPESGKLIPARNLKLYAPKEVANLYNAFYSKGLEDTSLKPTYMLARNLINTNTMLELGLSAYHFSTITMQSLNQDMGRFLRNALAGDWQGVGDAVKGLVTPALHFRKGMELEQQYKDLIDHGVDMERIADLFAKSNLRLGIDPLSNISTHGGFYKAWQRGELPSLVEKLKSQMKQGYGAGALKSGAEVVGRVVSDVSHPLFNVYIPAIKMSAFHDLMGDWLRQNPGASDAQIQQHAVRLGDLVEDRFGEMNMENLFWNKKAKEALGLGLRAPGWDLGLVRQVGGAGYDVYRLIKDGISGKGIDPSRLDRPLFMVGAAVVYAAINSAMTYIKTGTQPSDQKVKDLIAYATGGMHKAFGWHPERGELPGHGRELIQMAPIPGEGPLSGVTQEGENKIATLPKKTFEALNNTDWSGKPIYDPKSKNWVQRIPGVAQAVHIAKGFEPFSVEQLFEGAPEHSNLSFAERFLGVRAAGAKIVNPEGLAKFNKEKKH